jgi:hypothetical protein
MLNVQDIRNVYADAFGKAAALPGHLEAFAAWITRGEIGSMQKAIAEASGAHGVGRRPDHTAALGFAIYCGGADVRMTRRSHFLTPTSNSFQVGSSLLRERRLGSRLMA